MNIREIVSKHKNELPRYKLVGYTGLAVPMLKVKINCLVQGPGRLPVVQEFILNLLSEGLEIERIIKLLALDNEVIESAFSQLLQAEYISILDNQITQKGRDYLEDNILDHLEEEEYIINVDGLTGKIVPGDKKLTPSKLIKQNHIRTIKGNIKDVLIEDVDFKALKNEVIRQKRKKENEIIDNSEYKELNIIDIISITRPKSYYNRINILVLENEQNEYRILAYEGYKQIYQYEEALFELEKRSRKVLQYEMKGYFECNKVNEFSELVSNNECKIDDILELRKRIESYIQTTREELMLVFSLTSMTQLDADLIEEIKLAIKRGIKIKIVITGKEAISQKQKDIIDSLMYLVKDNKKVSLEIIPQFFSEVFIQDNVKGIAVVLEKNEIELDASKMGIVEVGYELDKEQIKYVKEEISSCCEQMKNKLSEVDTFESKDKMHQMINSIFKLSADLDQYMHQIDHVGWYDNQVANFNEIQGIPIATDKNKYKVFADIMNNNLVEKLEKNIEKHIHTGKPNDVQKYFNSTFKRRYPELHYSLHKLKVYRNKQSHDILSSTNAKYYKKFIDEDLCGCDPNLITNGYILLQAKLLRSLYNSMIKTLRRLKKNDHS